MRKVSLYYNLLRGGAYYARLRCMEQTAPRIRMSDAGEIKTSFSGVFAPAARDADGKPLEIDWFRDEIQPVLALDGVSHPLGVFLPATPRETVTEGRESVSVEAYDRGWIVRDTRAVNMPYWPAGTRYLDAVEQLLTSSGIKTVFKTPSTAEFSEAREDWDIGTSYLEIVNTLLREINYNPLWFDSGGNAILEPAATPGAGLIRHKLNADDKTARVLPSISRETDLYSAPNVWVVTCANPEKGTLMRAVAEIDNPLSPLSIARRGRRIVSVQNLNNIASQAALQAYADRLRNESLITAETVRISTGLLPGFGVGDLVALNFGDLTALCIERAYDMELRVGGRMTHTLERVVYALDA